MYMVSFPEITRQFKICIASVGIDFSVRAELSFHIRHTLVSQTVQFTLAKKLCFVFLVKYQDHFSNEVT